MTWFYRSYAYSGKIPSSAIEILIHSYLVLYYLQWPRNRVSLDEWIEKTWHMHTVEFYSVIRENEIMIFTNIKISQTHKDKYCMFPLITGS